MTARLALPKLIWILWLQGWDKAPEIVRACLKTWQNHNRGWTVRALSVNDLRTTIDDAAVLSAISAREMRPESISNVIRIALLRQHGGVWADSTTYCLRPLDQWLPQHMATGFFAFAKPAVDRMVSSWFLAAAPGNHIVTIWAKRTLDHWAEHAARDEYFWFHRLFAECYATDARFCELWDATPKLSADGPHYYVPQDVTLFRPLSPKDRELIESAAVPLLKLSHKLPSPDYPSGSVLRYLCDRANTRTVTGFWRALRSRVT